MNLNGHRPAHRNRWLLLEHLKPSEYLLYDFLIDRLDWDKRHKRYGTYEFLPNEIASIFKKKEKTILDAHRKLLKLGLVSVVDKRLSRYTITRFKRYISQHLGGDAEESVKNEKSISSAYLFQLLTNNNQKREPVLLKNGQTTPIPIKQERNKALGFSNNGFRGDDLGVHDEFLEQVENIFLKGDSTLSEDDENWIENDLRRK